MNEQTEKTYRYKPEPTLKNTSYYATEKDGCLYHYCGKTRIKVSEHFSDHGKSVGELIENVILHTANNVNSQSKCNSRERSCIYREKRQQ